MNIFLVSLVSALGLCSLGCSGISTCEKKPTNHAQELDEIEEVSELDRDKPNLFDRNRDELREFRNDPQRYMYRYENDPALYRDPNQQQYQRNQPVYWR